MLNKCPGRGGGRSRRTSVAVCGSVLGSVCSYVSWGARLGGGFVVLWDVDVVLPLKRIILRFGEVLVIEDSSASEPRSGLYVGGDRSMGYVWRRGSLWDEEFLVRPWFYR